MNRESTECPAGFWRRLCANLLDLILIVVRRVLLLRSDQLERQRHPDCQKSGFLDVTDSRSCVRGYKNPPS
jgi:hypothetical protein